MGERRGLGKVGFVRGFPAFLFGLKELMPHSGVDQETFDRCIEDQLDSPESFTDDEGKPCLPNKATMRRFKTPFKSPDGGLDVFLTLKLSPGNPSELSSPEWRTSEGLLRLTERKQSFALQEGGSVEDFERTLRSVVEERPLLLAELKAEMESRGFRWTGRPKAAIAEMATVAVVQDRHPQPVDFVVLKSKVEDEGYLSQNRGFMVRERQEAMTDAVAEQSDEDGLFQFAVVPVYRYVELEGMALKESWTVAKDQPYQVLINYLKYTFLKARQSPKTFVEEPGEYAIFNTGLVNKNYEWIYAYFEPNKNQGKKWFLAGFCSVGDRGDTGLGKRVSAKVGNHLPAKVVWLGPEELYFDVEKPIHTDWTHLVRQRIERLPADFVRRNVDKGSEVDEMYSQIQTREMYREKAYENVNRLVSELAKGNDARFSRYRGRVLIRKEIEYLGCEANLPDELKKTIADYLGAVNEVKGLYATIQRTMNEPEYDTARFEIVNRLKMAIELATKKIRWDYATAVPAYYPTANSFGFLLPLFLVGTEKAGAALVVSKTEGGYQGQTILTEEMAYSNARLLRKPDALWITKWSERN